MIFRRFSYRQIVKKTTVSGDLHIHMDGTPSDDPGDEGPSPDSFAKERTAYLQRMRKRYRPLALDALVPAPEQDSHPVMMLDEVFVPQLVRENPPPFELLDLPREVLRRLSEGGHLRDLPEAVDAARVEQAQRAYHDRPAIPILDAVGGSERIVVLGDPGAGKSTLSAYLMFALAVTELEHDEHETIAAALPSVLHGRLPLLIELRSYADPAWRGKSFLDFADELHHNHNLGLPKAHLEQFLLDDGPAVVVFDGLDEIFDPAVRDDVSSQIDGFATRYPDLRVIVTSRVIGYNRARFDKAGFSTFMLQDLDPGRIETFATQWYTRVHPGNEQEAARKRTRLLEAVERSPAIAELAGNPMLLTILAIIARGQELPRDRGAVYKHAVEVLIQHWDVNKHLRATDVTAPLLDKRDKLAMLHRVARRMQGGPAGLAGNHLPGDVLTEEFEGYLTDQFELPKHQAVHAARAMLDQFQKRNFILSSFGAEVYGFVHRAFLEYLAAEDINDRLTNQRKLRDGDVIALFGDRASDPTWREVLLLLVGLVPEPLAVDIITGLGDRETHWRIRTGLPAPQLLALSAASEIRNRITLKALSAGTTSVLCELLTAAARRETEGDIALGQAIREALPALDAPPPWLDTIYFERWYKHWSSRQPSFVTSGIAADVYLSIQPQNAPSLTSLAITHHWASVRLAALEAIAQAWPQDPDTLALLRDRATHDDHWAVRQHAIQTVASLRPQDADTRSWLRDRATHDDNWAVRLDAVEAITRHYLRDADTISWLRDRMGHDGSWVRRTAIRTIAQDWPQDPDTLPLLRDRATHDNHWIVRQTAIDLIGQGWPQDPDTLPWLRDRATHDHHRLVRQHAIERIVQDWPQHPDALSWLRNRAAYDDHQDVRTTAARAIAHGWPENPGTLPFLKDHAFHDRHQDVRRAVVQAIAEGWPDEPDTLLWLRDRATHDHHQDVRKAAVLQIARGWPHEPDTLPWLRNHTTHDHHQDVREAAIQAIAEGWPQHPDTLPLLHHHATHSPHTGVRQAAVSAIARGWLQDQGTLPLLHDRATHDDHQDVRKTAVQAIAEGWPDDPETLPLLRGRAAHDDHEDVQHTAAELIGWGWSQDPGTLPLLLDRVTDDNWTVRQAAVEVLARAWARIPEAKSQLGNYAVHDVHWFVRRTAVEAIARGWPQDSDTLRLLHDRATHDDRKEVRQAAVELIARGWPQNLDTLPLLHDRATHDDHQDVRRTAAKIVARGWSHDPDALSLLYDRATHDDHREVRKAALKMFAEVWSQDSGTLNLLRDRASYDDNGRVRQAAMEAVTQGWPQDPNTLALLRDRATHDNDHDVRRAAVHGITRGWSQDPDTLLLLRDATTHDQDAAVRKAAVEAIAEGWPRHPDTLPLLHHRATHDDHQDVRKAAVQAIAEDWPHDPETLPLLRDRAAHDDHQDVREAAEQAIEQIHEDSA